MVWLKPIGSAVSSYARDDERLVDEDVARHVADAIEHREVRDALLLQALDQPVARARGRHADAGEALDRHHADPTQLRTVSSAA